VLIRAPATPDDLAPLIITEEQIEQILPRSPRPDQHR